VPEIVRFSQYRIDPDTPPSIAFPKGYVLNLALLDVQLRVGSRTTPFLPMQIDSGSAYCIFGSQVADELGLRVPSGKLKRGIQGLGGTFDLYFFDVEMVIGSLRIECYAGFMERTFPGRFYVGLLGDQGFLNKIAVAFDPEKLQIRIG
jgi:hypothetical protein